MINNLEAILSEGESYTIEFKESPDRGLPSEVCAFANASGGMVYIGVHDDGYVVGTDTGNTARSRIQDSINKIKPQLDVSMGILDNVIVLTVPEGTHKPYSCPAGFYLRSGPNSQKLDRDSIIKFFQSEGRVRYDEILREDLPVAGNFNEEAYKKFIRLAGISEVLGRDAILRNLKCAGDVRGKLCFTNAGALFFRKNDEDIEFRHTEVVCALYKGLNKVYILDTKELGGDIMSKVDNTVLFLKKHLRMSYKIVSVRRENILELPEDALREAIVNAVCHRDYFEKGARVMVEIFDDRVNIVSPGGVCKGITPENFGTISITRNNTIATLLHRSDYIEQMGTGIERMRNAARDAQVAEPEFELSDFFKVTFKRDAILSSEASDRQAIAVDRQAIETSDRRSVILTHLEEHRQVTATAAATLLGLSKSRTRAVLLAMVNDGMLEKISDKRYAYYVLKSNPQESEGPK